MVSVSPRQEASSSYSGSDIFYPHESWVTYKHKAKALAVDSFGVQGKIDVKPIHGGSYNRVVSIMINGQPRYILRIPRCPEKSDVEGEVAPLLFLQRHTPILSPKVTAYDIRANNVINAPFMIQERLPGICLYPGWFNITDTEKLRVAHDLGVVFRQILNTRSSKPGRLLFPVGQTGLNADVFLVPIRPKYEAPWHLHSAQGAQPWDPKSPATQSVAEFMKSLIQTRVSNALKCWPKNKKTPEMLSRLIGIIEEIDKRGSLRNVQYSLYHWDIAARNIIFNAEAGKNDSCLGIIDWDDCLFAPSFMPCEPPSWLWDSSKLRSISAESLIETSPGDGDGEFSAKLRQVFTDAAGPEYQRYSQDPIYEITRKIVEYGIKGTRDKTDEKGEEAAELLELWQEYIKKH
ncbi:Protein kinase-like domain containing protein [Naviculisporaceae sp. PSN 640]